MITTDPKRPGSRMGPIDRLFADHPRSLEMSWAAHARGALAIGAKLSGAAVACFVHAVVPGWFTETAGRTIAGLHAHMSRRKAEASNPENWPEYEI